MISFCSTTFDRVQIVTVDCGTKTQYFVYPEIFKIVGITFVASRLLSLRLVKSWTFTKYPLQFCTRNINIIHTIYVYSNK